MINLQTFLPFKDFKQTARCLDYKRLGKQRVEAMQILTTLTTNKNSRWGNHPAVKMWKGYEGILEQYKNIMIAEWIRRGYNNTMPITNEFQDNINYPPWITEEFCTAHRSNLLRKNCQYYSKFNWNVADKLPYIWPV